MTADVQTPEQAAPGPMEQFMRDLAPPGEHGDDCTPETCGATRTARAYDAERAADKTLLADALAKFRQIAGLLEARHLLMSDIARADQIANDIIARIEAAKEGK